MLGILTRKLENISFEKRHPLLWGAIHTFAKSEKTVQGFLESRGIESYLPMLTQYKDGKKTDQVLQTPGYIYACWDCHRHPGLCTPRNKMYRNEMHHVDTEDGILESMIVCRKLELISNTYPVTACGTPPIGETVTLPDGELAGSQGILRTEDGIPFFYLMLDAASGYARIQLTDVDEAENLRQSLCSPRR